MASRTEVGMLQVVALQDQPHPHPNLPLEREGVCIAVALQFPSPVRVDNRSWLPASRDIDTSMCTKKGSEPSPVATSLRASRQLLWSGVPARMLLQASAGGRSLAFPLCSHQRRAIAPIGRPRRSKRARTCMMQVGRTRNNIVEGVAQRRYRIGLCPDRRRLCRGDAPLVRTRRRDSLAQSNQLRAVARTPQPLF
jgi:hypothetical protein